MPLSAGDRIRNLLATYCHLVDAADFEGVGELMADAVLRSEDGDVLATGAQQVRDLYAGLVRLGPDGTPGTQHLVLNTALTVLDPPVGGTGRVQARSSYVVLQATADLPLQPVVTGSYLDTFAEDGASGWRFVERRFGVRLAGDLSQHLTVDLVDAGTA